MFTQELHQYNFTKMDDLDIECAFLQDKPIVFTVFLERIGKTQLPELNRHFIFDHVFHRAKHGTRGLPIHHTISFLSS